MQQHAPFWTSSCVTVWLQLFDSCTGCQSLRRSSTSCACWFTSRFWDTRRNISQTFWHWLPIFQVDLHCALHRVATSSCRGHVDKLATEPFLLLHREHGTIYRLNWNCCDRRTRFIVIWKHFCFILSTGTRVWTDSAMCPRSSSRGRNTSASVTITVNLDTNYSAHLGNWIQVELVTVQVCHEYGIKLCSVSLSF